MNMCQGHWDQLRAAIEERGLTALVPDTGEQAASNFMEQVSDQVTIDNFDPLMGAFFAIGSNGGSFIARMGGDPLIIMTEQEVPFNKCTICYLNWIADEHDKECTNAECTKPPGEAAHYEWMIRRAADDQVAVWKQLNAER